MGTSSAATENVYCSNSAIDKDVMAMRVLLHVSQKADIVDL
jgi:hypothetical protein